MTLLLPKLSPVRVLYDNWGANPSSTPGGSVAPGTSNAEGSWIQLASAANISADVCGVFLTLYGGASTGVAKNQLLDIGVDPAGGTSYTPIISNLVCGYSTTSITNTGLPRHWFFPIRIRAGSTVAVRIQGSHTTAGSVIVGVRFYAGGGSLLPVGTFSETIGTITNSQGVSFTPGNAADGTWTSLGTTTNPLWWWQIGWQISNSTMTAEQTYIELAVGDGSNYDVIQRVFHQGTTGEIVGQVYIPNLLTFESYHPVPAGSTMYIRGRCVNAPDSGYNAVAVGVG